MNKRILCLLLSFVMLASVMLTGCSKKNAEEVIIEDAAKNTVTLSMYLMSETEVSAEQEAKIEEAVNLITKSKFKIQLDLRYFTPDKYYEALESSFVGAEQDKANKKNNNKGNAAKTSGGEAATEAATIINQYGIPELAYPTISENQVDIFYVGGYNRIDSYIMKNWITTVDDALASDAQIITDYVSEVYLTYLKSVNRGTYMVPSNAPAGEYTYMLLNKEMLEKYNYSSTKGFKNLTSEDVKDLLANVAAYDKDYVPLYSGTGELDLVDITYYGVDANGALTYDFSVFGGRSDPTWKYLAANNFYDFHNIFSSLYFKEQMRTLTEYRLNGYYGTEADANKKFAIGYLKGSADIVEEYGDEYELVVINTPKMSTDELFANGFAVSTFTGTANTPRAMDVITYINTNVEFRNLILYGIEGDNYEIVEKEVDGVTYKTVARLNDSYMMDVNKTGNVTIAYPTVDELPNIREYQKIQNRDTSVMLDLGFVLAQDDPTDKYYKGVTSIEDMDPAVLDELIYGGMTEEEIEAKIEEGVTKELEDDHDYINIAAMQRLAAYSDELKAEMLAVESIEALDAFFTKAENDLNANRDFQTMVNILYDRYYKNDSKPELTYNAAEYGAGAGFANLYKQWLDAHKLWVE